MAGLLGTKDERAALALADAANRLLGNGHVVPPGFVNLLFARVVPEDLIGYSPDSRARLRNFCSSAAGANRKSGLNRPRVRRDSGSTRSR